MLEVNRIYCGNCLELMKEIDNESIDLIVTDPPYNTGMNSKVTSPVNHPSVGFNSNKTAKKPRLFGFFNDNMSKEQYQEFVNNTSK